MIRVFRVCLLTTLALLATSTANAQNQFFPGAPQAAYVFDPLAGTQPAPAQPTQLQTPPRAGVWHIQPPPAAQTSQFPAMQGQNPVAPWFRPPVGPIPGQLAPATLIDRRTGLPIQIAVGQSTAGQPAGLGQSQAGLNTAARPQATLSPYGAPLPMSPPARQFWRGVRGYGQSDFGQNRGFSSYGQNRFNQTRSGYSRYNQSRASQSYPQPSFHNQSRFNQSHSNTSLHNVVVPYGRNWR